MENDKIKISTDALISAHALRNNNLQKRHLVETTTEVVRRISQELISAHKEGRHHIITNIPITYNIPHLSNKDSQRIIWSNIIETIISKNYRIWISPGKDICRIKITWMSPEDETDIKTQMNLIAKHTMDF